jgi:hypothetical protein
MPSTFDAKLPHPELINNLINTLEQLYAQNHTVELKHKLNSAKTFIEVIETFKAQKLLEHNTNLVIRIDTVQKPEAIFKQKKAELSNFVKFLT